MDDASAKVLHRKKKSGLTSYLNAADKREVVHSRTANKAVAEQYYKYQYE